MGALHWEGSSWEVMGGQVRGGQNRTGLMGERERPTVLPWEATQEWFGRVRSEGRQIQAS
jgi:hypothetical protein